jgi:hypothetical protein
VARVRRIRNSYTVSEGKIQLVGLRGKMVGYHSDGSELGGCELYTSASGQGQVVDCREERKEASVSQNGGLS